MRLLKPDWNRNKEIYIWIFDVGRGLSAFIKTPHNFGMMIDCGASDDFKPFDHIVKKHFLPCLDRPFYRDKRWDLAQVVISHPHTDHCLEIESVLQHANPMLFTTPHSNPQENDPLEHVNWSLISNPEQDQQCVEILRREANKRIPPLRAYVSESGFSIPGFSLGIFFIPPGLVEKHLEREHYANNLSVVVRLGIGGNSILFMGDLIESGCEYLLKTNREFRSAVETGASIVVAPHHGLKSGFCQQMYNLMPGKKVQYLNLISEKRDVLPGQGETHPSYTSGVIANGYGERKSLSTKNDGHIRIIMGAGNKIKIDSSQNIENLLED